MSNASILGFKKGDIIVIEPRGRQYRDDCLNSIFEIKSIIYQFRSASISMTCVGAIDSKKKYCQLGENVFHSLTYEEHEILDYHNITIKYFKQLCEIDI